MEAVAFKASKYPGYKKDVSILKRTGDYLSRIIGRSPG